MSDYLYGSVHPHDRVVGLLHLHGTVEAALAATDPAKGHYDSRADHEAVRVWQRQRERETAWAADSQTDHDRPPVHRTNPGPHDRGHRLVALHGSEAAALKATHPDTSVYDSRADFDAVMALRDAPEPVWLMKHGGPPVEPLAMRQEDVGPSVIQASCTATGVATVLPTQPQHAPSLTRGERS